MELNRRKTNYFNATDKQLNHYRIKARNRRLINIRCRAKVQNIFTSVYACISISSVHISTITAFTRLI